MALHPCDTTPNCITFIAKNTVQGHDILIKKRNPNLINHHHSSRFDPKYLTPNGISFIKTRPNLIA